MGGSVSISTALPPSNQESVGSRPKPLKVEKSDPQLPALHTMKKINSLAKTYRTYCLAGRFLHYDDTVSRYIAKSLKKVISQRIAHLSNQKNQSSIISFLATIEVTCDTNKIHEDAAIWALRYYVQETGDPRRRA